MSRDHIILFVSLKENSHKCEYQLHKYPHSIMCCKDDLVTATKLTKKPDIIILKTGLALFLVQKIFLRSNKHTYVDGQGWSLGGLLVVSPESVTTY